MAVEQASVELRAQPSIIVDGRNVAPVKLSTRSTYIGGDWTAVFVIEADGIETGTTLSGAFGAWLGKPVDVAVNGVKFWSGYIARLDLDAYGIRARRSIERGKLINAVNVYYSNGIGNRAHTGWFRDDASQRIYGDASLIASLAGATDDQAEALAQSLLAEHAIPKTRAVNASNQTRLTVTAVGYWAMLSRVYHEQTFHDTASASIATLLKETAVGDRKTLIEDNDIWVKNDCTVPQRISDLIRAIALQGDMEGNLYRAGFFRGRFVYERIHDRGLRLEDVLSTQAVNVLPGFYVSTPALSNRIATNPDDPGSFVGSINLTYSDRGAAFSYGLQTPPITLIEQIRRGTHGVRGS